MIGNSALFILCLFIISFQVPTPFQTTNPKIQTGIRNLVQNSNDFVNKTSITQNTNQVVAFDTTFLRPFQTVPSVVLGILSYKFDSTYLISSSYYFIDVYILSTNLNKFQIGLMFQINKSFLVNYLDVMFMAVQISNSPQFIFFSRYFRPITVSSSSDVSINYYQSFTRTPVDYSDVIYMVAITGHQHRLTYLQFEIKTYSQNNNQFRVKIYSPNLFYLKMISFSLIAIDKNILQQSYKDYYTTYQIVQSNQSYLFSISTPVKDLYFLGFSQISLGFNINCGFKTLLQPNISITNYPNFNYLRINALLMIVTKCSIGYYYNGKLGACVQNCYSGVKEQRYCILCIDYCADCITNITCRTCIETRQIQFDSNNQQSCVCKIGYQQVGLEKCFNCNQFSFGCLRCSQSTNSCTSCNTVKFFTAIPDSFGQCYCQINRRLDVDNSKCVCLSRFYNQSGICKSCHVSCKQCNGPSFLQCTQCDQDVFRIMNGTKCICKFSQFKQLCVTTGTNCNATVCYFDPSIKLQIKVLDIVKNEEKNSLQFTISLLPDIPLFQQIDLTQFLSFGFKFSFQKFKYDNGIITTQIAYQQDIHNKQFQIKLNFSKHSSISFSKTQLVTTKYAVLPSNDLAAQYFQSSDYLIAKYLGYIIYGLLVLALFAFISGLHSSKLVVSEMIGIIQVSYLGIFMLNYNTPLMVPMTKLRYSFGFNDILPASYGNLPLRIKKAGYNQLVLANLNVTLSILVIPLILSLTFLFLSKIRRKNKNGYLSLSKLFIGEWMMVVILFITYNISTSTTIFAFNSTTRDWKFIISIIQISVTFILIILISLMYLFTDYNFFGQFKYMFKWSTFQLNYYVLQIAIRIIIGCIFGAAHIHFSSGIVAACLFIIISLITLIKNPFADKLHTIRSTVNTTIGGVIIILYTYIAASGPSSGFKSKVPLIILVLLFLNIVMAIVFIIRQFIASSKIQSELQEPNDLLDRQNKQQQEFMRKQIEQAMKEGAHNSFARKLYIEKNKKYRKKKRPLMNIIDDDIIEKQIEQPIQVKKKKKKRQTIQNGLNIQIEENMFYTTGENGIYQQSKKKSIKTLKQQNNQLDPNSNQLTKQRIFMVDKMIRQGLL